MNVNQLMAELRKIQKDGHGKTECLMFPGDNDDMEVESGDGPVFSVGVVTRNDGSVIVSLRA